MRAARNIVLLYLKRKAEGHTIVKIFGNLQWLSCGYRVAIAWLSCGYRVAVEKAQADVLCMTSSCSQDKVGARLTALQRNHEAVCVHAADVFVSLDDLRLELPHDLVDLLFSKSTRASTLLTHHLQAQQARERGFLPMEKLCDLKGCVPIVRIPHLGQTDFL